MYCKFLFIKETFFSFRITIFSSLTYWQSINIHFFVFIFPMKSQIETAFAITSYHFIIYCSPGLDYLRKYKLRCIFAYYVIVDHDIF